MDSKTARTFLPPYWRGVKRNHVSIQHGFNLCAMDTETFYGRVFATGFKSEMGPLRINYGLGSSHFKWFLECLFSLGSAGKRTTICGGHYVVFDLGVLLWEILNPRGSTLSKAPIRSYFSYLWRGLPGGRNGSPAGTVGVEIEIFWKRPCFARFKWDGRTVFLIDTFAFFNMGLKPALKMLGCKTQKLKKPKDLGRRLIPKKEVTPYLNNDVVGVIELLKEIVKLHEQYQTRLCVSLPQLSSRIFRHFYLRKDFAVPPPALLGGALLSYHGGKNSFPGRAGWFRDCFDLDINSAYPEAMAQLPNFETGKWVLGRGIGFLKKYPHGIYKISGHLRACVWGSLFTHDFKKFSGDFKNLWVTGYEIAEAIRSGHLELKSLRGYGFKEGGGDSAFKKFVADFYAKKQAAKTKPEAYFYKLILNSLYGKFIQRTEDDDGRRVAGSMFDPAIASLITGYVRAKIHGLEHRYQSIHTATDGFITKRPPFKRDLGNEIGKLKSGDFGDVLILRNKLYLFFDKNGIRKKSGLHGFQGNPELLEKLWRSSKRIYSVERLTRWSEAWHTQIPPGRQVTQRRELILK